MVAKTVKGVVIEESLVGGQLPQSLQRLVVDRYNHLLGGTIPVHVLILHVELPDLPTVAFVLSESLLDHGFYAHFVAPERLNVVFPNCICTVVRNDSITLSRCRNIGLTIGIPADQMLFERLFLDDHPNAH